MPSQYKKGANFENQVKDILNNGGWFAIRSAGSHSPIDILAINPKEKWLIQCRTGGNLSRKEREELINLAGKYNSTPILAYKKEGNVIFEEIKSREPTFHYEFLDGRFIKVDN